MNYVIIKRTTQYRKRAYEWHYMVSGKGMFSRSGKHSSVEKAVKHFLESSPIHKLSVVDSEKLPAQLVDVEEIENKLINTVIHAVDHIKELL